jgi:hypothetical protein
MVLQFSLVNSTPRKQSEDLGDDAIKSSYYGVQNLKRVMAHLIEWTNEPNRDYSALKAMENQTLTQFRRYIYHVQMNIGMYTFTEKTVEEPGDYISFVPREKQKRAVQFLQEQLFDAPDWLTNKEIFSKTGAYGPYIPLLLEENLIPGLLTYDRYARMVYYDAPLKQDR